METLHWPTELEGLIGATEVLTGLTLADLREMSKFAEQPNVLGLAVHPSPPQHQGELRIRERLSSGARRALELALRRSPLILVRGQLAGDSASSTTVQYLVPQDFAHVAAVLRLLLWPAGDDVTAQVSGAADWTMLVWPEPLADRRGRVLLEGGVIDRLGEGWCAMIGREDVRDLAACTLDFCREALNGGDEVAPWCGVWAEGGDLAEDESLRRAAAGVGTMLFGIDVDEAGRIPLLAVHGLDSGLDDAIEVGVASAPRSDARGFAIIPRRAT